MKVKELIELLKTHNPEAVVILGEGSRPDKVTGVAASTDYDRAWANVWNVPAVTIN